MTLYRKNHGNEKEKKEEEKDEGERLVEGYQVVKKIECLNYSFIGLFLKENHNYTLCGFCLY